MDDKGRYELYDRLFAEIPGLHFGLVSGFIHKERGYYYAVEEHGIPSYQSIERQFDFVSPLFTEFRCYIEVPSEFFGKDVAEVWKFFRRNSNELHLAVWGMASQAAITGFLMENQKIEVTAQQQYTVAVLCAILGLVFGTIHLIFWFNRARA